MVLNEFVRNLRLASQVLPEEALNNFRSPLSTINEFVGVRADVWLSPRSVDGFRPEDFGNKPAAELKKLETHVNAFLDLTNEISQFKRIPPATSKSGRKHLEAAIEIVRRWIVADWVADLNWLMDSAAEAARTAGWHTEELNKVVEESLLGKYACPRLRVRSLDAEVYLDPVAYFGAGGKGIVDLLHVPTFERICSFTFKDGQWRIWSLNSRNSKSRPFKPSAFLQIVKSLKPKI